MTGIAGLGAPAIMKEVEQWGWLWDVYSFRQKV